jgi:hypothetical protein
MDDNPLGGMGSTTPSVNPEEEMGFAASRMRRKAIANALRSSGSIKHGLVHAPMIQHPKDSSGNSGIPGFSTGRRFRGLKRSSLFKTGNGGNY